VTADADALRKASRTADLIGNADPARIHDVTAALSKRDLQLLVAVLAVTAPHPRDHAAALEQWAKVQTARQERRARYERLDRGWQLVVQDEKTAS
jgi:hypothetical protein